MFASLDQIQYYQLIKPPTTYKATKQQMSGLQLYSSIIDSTQRAVPNIISLLIRISG